MSELGTKDQNADGVSQQWAKVFLTISRGCGYSLTTLQAFHIKLALNGIIGNTVSIQVQVRKWEETERCFVEE